MSSWYVYAIGFTAQIFFSARLLTQWIASERAKKVLSPSLFWILSLGGAIFLFTYGLLRFDLAIVLGQVINYYVYCRNLWFKGVWQKIFRGLQIFLVFLPFAAIAYLYFFHIAAFDKVFDNEDISLNWLIIGTMGQITFVMRFIYQWYVSEKRSESQLPPGFFIISVIGSLIILSYGIYRKDPVLVIGHAGGLFVYVRNLMIHYGGKQ